MEDSIHVLKLNLNDAKTYAHERIVLKSAARPSNILAAIGMIDRAKSVKALSFAIANYVLSHDFQEKVLK